MKFWEDIVNKASLGSAKLPLKASDVPVPIAEEFDLVDTDETEEDFLRFTSLASQFRQNAVRPLNLKTLVQMEAAAETKPYCSSASMDALMAILAEELPPFFELWLKLCASKGQLAHPFILPVLLDRAQHKKSIRRLVTAVAGKRGEWLATLNPNWNFISAPAEDTVATWETGSPEERKELLRTLREQDPEAGLTMLKTTWASEGANEKAAFLELLKINLSSADLPWLEGLKEKGQKVNNGILDLLKSIPSSSIVLEYADVLKNTIRIKTGKALLGMISKNTLDLNDSFSIPETIFKTGVDKLSSDKNVSDQQYIRAQLMAAVPPSFWNQHLQLSTKEIIELFQKEKQHAFYLPAIALAAVRFKDIDWIKNILDHGSDVVIGGSVVTLIDALPEPERDAYAVRYMKEQPQQIVQLMIDSENEWSVDLAKAILKYTASEIYQYNRTFYRPAATLIPVALLEKLDSFEPSEEQKKVYWGNQAGELARLLTIKQQTLQSFHA